MLPSTEELLKMARQRRAVLEDEIGQTILYGELDFPIEEGRVKATIHAGKICTMAVWVETPECRSTIKIKVA